MKAIIYAGIGLFSVATVYGLTDYYSSKKSGDLEKLYVEEEPAVAKPAGESSSAVLPVAMNETVLPEATAMTSKAKTKKKAKKPVEKLIRAEDFSRAKIPEPVIDEAVIIEEKKPEPAPEKITTEVKEKPEIKFTERKISSDMFSRAPLKKKVKPAKTEKQ